jgi:hypothetical protein
LRKHKRKVSSDTPTVTALYSKGWKVSESKKSTQLLRAFPYKVYDGATKYPLSPDVMVEVTPFSDQMEAMRARFSRSYRLKSLRRRRLALVLISKW